CIAHRKLQISKREDSFSQSLALSIQLGVPCECLNSVCGHPLRSITSSRSWRPADSLLQPTINAIVLEIPDAVEPPSFFLVADAPSEAGNRALRRWLPPSPEGRSECDGQDRAQR